MKTIYLAGGCFWGMQKFIDQFEGVLRTEVGYANGPSKAPSYEEVCRSSGHAETVKIEYDEEKITLTELLRYYFAVIDPLSVNKQGNDRGIQYRTGIYYTEKGQMPEIETVYQNEEAKYGTQLEPSCNTSGKSVPGPASVTKTLLSSAKATPQSTNRILTGVPLWRVYFFMSFWRAAPALISWSITQSTSVSGGVGMAFSSGIACAVTPPRARLTNKAMLQIRLNMILL